MTEHSFALAAELKETIEGESRDIQKLEAIIESKRQHIADCMKVLSALNDGGFLR